MAIRFGVSPIAWINDDMPELGGDTPLERVLQEAHEIGFEGIELGGAFPREPRALGALLREYGLALVGGWYSASLLQRSAAEEWSALQAHLALLRALGTDVFILAETSNAIHGQRGQPLDGRPRLDARQWRVFGARTTELASRLAEAGMRMAYHHHLGTVVEDAQDLVAFIENTGDAAGLTLDTGHAALGGIGPVETIRSVPKRIAHVHCKDIRSGVFRAVQSARKSFLDGVLAGMFTAPGDGSIDYAEVMQALREIGYDGWIIVEAEQDPAVAPPKRFQQLGLQTLRREAAAAGLLP